MADRGASGGPRVSNRAGAPVGLIAAVRAALPDGLRRPSHKRCAERFRSRSVWAIAGASKLLGVPSSQCGAVTFVQLWEDALNANPHFHSLVLDGV